MEANLVTVILRPVDKGWVMGEDYPVQIPLDMTVVNLYKFIEEKKGISRHRQQLRLTHNEKLIPKEREIWAIRRHGISNGTVVKLEPTRPGAWLWNPLNYYTQKLLDEVLHTLVHVKCPMVIEELETHVKCPPPINTSLRTFLREHPDSIRLRSDVSSNKVWVYLAEGFQLPTFETCPMNLGSVRQFVEEEFDWDNYAEVDSMKPVSSTIKLPNIYHDICIRKLCDLSMYAEKIKDQNVFVVVRFNGSYAGHTAVRCMCRSPRWNDARVQIGIPFGSDLRSHVLRCEVWRHDSLGVSLCAAVDVTGHLLETFISSEFSSSFPGFPLYRAVAEGRAGGTADLLSSFSPTSTHMALVGGRASYQVKINHVAELSSPDPRLANDINPYVVVFWNNIDIGATDIQKKTRNPTWTDAIFNIPVPGNMEPSQCSLSFQVWHAEDMGGGKVLMSSVSFSGPVLRDMLRKFAPHATRQIIDLQLPVAAGKREDEGGRKKKGQQVSKCGIISIIIGPAGLQEKQLKYFEINVLMGSGLARTEVYCVLMWNGGRFGMTPAAKSVSETPTSVKWRWNRCKLIFEVAATENIAKSSLQIDLFDPNMKGNNSFIGCIILTGEELTKLIDADFAAVNTFSLKKDPKRDEKSQKISKGSLQLRGGGYGYRMAEERTIDILGASGLKVDGEGIGCYCVLLWNEVEVTRTKVVVNDGSPVFGVFDDRWGHVAINGIPDVFYAQSNSTLVVEVWEDASYAASLLAPKEEAADEHTIVTEENVKQPWWKFGAPKAAPKTVARSAAKRGVFYGAISLSGEDLREFLETQAPKMLTLELADRSKVGGRRVTKQIQGEITIGTPGLGMKSPMQWMSNLDEQATSTLQQAYQEQGPALFGGDADDVIPGAPYADINMEGKSDVQSDISAEEGDFRGVDALENEEDSVYESGDDAGGREVTNEDEVSHVGERSTAEHEDAIDGAATNKNEVLAAGESSSAVATGDVDGDAANRSTSSPKLS